MALMSGRYILPQSFESCDLLGISLSKFYEAENILNVCGGSCWVVCQMKLALYVSLRIHQSMFIWQI